MPTVYVLNKDGKPLMPTTRCMHVRHLLKNGKARVVKSKPFTIKLNYETPDIFQPLYLGIDPGRTNIGVAVVKEDGTPVFTAHLETRNKDITGLMSARKESRRQHRTMKRRNRRQRRAVKCGTTSKKCVKQTTSQSGNTSKRAQKIGVIKRLLPGCEKPVLCIGIKNKEARFNNRVRPAGWLTPTANQLAVTHINLIRKIQKFLPISDVVVELNRFAFMALENPKIQRWQYQQGPLYQKGSVENAVFEQQDGHCLFCKQPIVHYHHVVPRSERGSETLDNRVGLCTKHHDLVHKDIIWKEKLAEKKAGLNKKYGALGVLNQIFPKVFEALTTMFPEHVFVTDGKSTHDYRQKYNVGKDHWLDAYCIANSVVGKYDPTINAYVPYEMRQFRRHDRQALHKANMNRNYLLDGQKVATNRHKAMNQKTNSLEEFRMLSPEKICKLRIQKRYPQYRNMHRHMPGSVFLADATAHVMKGASGLHNGKADYYYDVDGRKFLARKCMFVANNSGLVFT